MFVLRRSKQRKGDQVCRTINENIISVDPPSFNKIDVVKDNKSIGSKDHLPITQIREEIRLHNNSFHNFTISSTKPTIAKN